MTVLSVHSDASYLTEPKARAEPAATSLCQVINLTTQQRRSTQHCTDNQGSSIIRSRSRSKCSLYQCSRGCSYANHPPRNGPSSTPPTPIQLDNQHNRPRIHQQEHQSQGLKSVGYETTLVMRQRVKKAIQILLAAGSGNARQLLMLKIPWWDEYLRGCGASLSS